MPDTRRIRLALWMGFISIYSVHMIHQKSTDKTSTAQIAGIPDLSFQMGHPESAGPAVIARPKDTLGIKVASATVVETVPTSELAAREQFLSRIYHSEAGHKAILDSTIDQVAALQRTISAQQSRIEKLEKETVLARAEAAKAATEAKAKESNNTVEIQQKNDLKKMVKLMSLIPSPKLIAMIGEMSDDQVSDVLVQMKDPEVAKIMGALPPRRAVVLGLRLTQRKKS